MNNEIPEVLKVLFLKNLKFFKNNHKSIYDLVNHIKLEHTSIKVDDSGKIELMYHGSPIYGGDAIKFTEDEVNEFCDVYKGGEIRSSTNIPFPGLYSIPRFFQSHMNETILELYHTSKDIDPNTLYHNDKYDFLVVTGIGLGLHISEILDRVEVRNLLIFETDYELLTISLFFTDWEEIYKKQNIKEGKSITIVSVKSDNKDIEYGSLWNELILRAPHFPFNTVFYNHGRHDKYGGYIRKIKDDQRMFMSLWGHYDDECNQVNHIMHNINNNVMWIPSKNEFKWDKPVVVCGSGPSLDSRIEQLKSIQKNTYVISAGTSLSVLLNNNIIPDFHIEIESDYNVYTTFESINRPLDLKKISLICGIQSSPYIHSLFKDSYSFAKDSLSCSDILDPKENRLRDATPTCVNAALSLALQFEASEVYLFGTDFGFYDVKKHHSVESIYNQKDEGSKRIRETSKKDMVQNFKKPGYLGDCLTTDIYYTTKRRIEMSLKYNKTQYKFKTYNCSDGLIVEETDHIININKSNSKSEFYKKCRNKDKNLNSTIKEKLNKTTVELSNILIRNLKIMPNNIEGISSTTWSISNYISSTFTQENGTLSFFIRGTIWHYMLAGYSISYATPENDREKVIIFWKNRFVDFLEKLPIDLNQTLNKKRSDIKDDESLTKTITESL